MTAIAFDGEGERMATASADRTIKLFRLGDEVIPERTLRLPTLASPSVALSPDGALVAAAHGNDLLLWDASRGGAPIHVIEGGGGDLAFTHDGRVLVSHRRDGVHFYGVR